MLQLCETYPDNNQYIEVLYFVSQLRVNMMPFVHQVSTLDLLRRKFQVCTVTTFLPNPSEDEMMAFILLLKHKNPKLSGILPFTLYQLTRYKEKCKYIMSNRRLIMNNLSIMIEQLFSLND